MFILCILMLFVQNNSYSLKSQGMTETCFSLHFVYMDILDEIFDLTTKCLERHKTGCLNIEMLANMNLKQKEQQRYQNMELTIAFATVLRPVSNITSFVLLMFGVIFCLKCFTSFMVSVNNF